MANITIVKICATDLGASRFCKLRLDKTRQSFTGGKQPHEQEFWATIISGC